MSFLVSVYWIGRWTLIVGFFGFRKIADTPSQTKPPHRGLWTAISSVFFTYLLCGTETRCDLSSWLQQGVSVIKQQKVRERVRKPGRSWQMGFMLQTVVLGLSGKQCTRWTCLGTLEYTYHRRVVQPTQPEIERVFGGRYIDSCIFAGHKNVEVKNCSSAESFASSLLALYYFDNERCGLSGKYDCLFSWFSIAPVCSHNAYTNGRGWQQLP